VATHVDWGDGSLSDVSSILTGSTKFKKLSGAQAAGSFLNFAVPVRLNSRAPDTFTKIENLFEDDEWAILEWSGGGNFKPTGKSFALSGCGFFHVVNGKIKFQRGYWDKHTWFSQVGLPLDP
jgi:hypothetical protein